ncbi:MAG: hypothetical protein AMJ62_00760 [Myxococcales bacterium SG8_38]|nr:MAG: hypothetical protein AMJ62_00760 [Myxococcales bacterium SG8_38]
MRSFAKGIGRALVPLLVLTTALAGCAKSKVRKGAEIGGAGADCYHYKTKDKSFKYTSQYATVETQWWDEWTSRYGKTLPQPLPPPEHWMHPKLSSRYAATMHENSFATDVSREPGPIPSDPKVEYFHVLEKGTKLSGMAPFYTFLDDQTVITISFGRDAATLVIVDISGEHARVLDYVALPGRGSKALELAKKSARMAMFRDTSGGAYSYLDAKGDVYVPGADNTVIRIPIRDRRVDRDKMVMLDLTREVEAGSWVDDAMKHPENHLTAIMPDADGRIWFTSKFGVVGMIMLEEGSGICPPVYTTAIIRFGLAEKLRYYYPDSAPPGAEDWIAKIEKYDAEGTLVEHLGELRREGKQIFGEIHIENEPFEQIQNSFSVGPDGVYIVTNVGLYKLFFKEETRQIELDPAWKPTYAKGNLFYANDRKVKPGHLNNGSGTTPTLVDDRFVAIVDNASDRVNLNVFRQSDGTLVTKLPLFQAGAGAVENSVVAYKDSLVVGNTYGYVDPFVENPTAGGIERYDYDLEKDTYVKVDGWPAVGHFDGKTATPKLSTAHGLFYVYHRDVDEDAATHDDWQLTALDLRTGWPVFSIKAYFEDRDFDDNVSGIVKKKTLGKKDYGRKVFNNIWGTFSFGPRNSIFIGTYRGYVRFSSAPELAPEAIAEGPAAN